MEGWSRQAKRDRDVLMGIVALLVSLAGFADRAHELGGRRRGQLLQILCYSDAVGRDFILGLMPAASRYYDDTDLDGEPEPPVADAAQLAATLRVLALVLYTVLQRPFAPAAAIRSQASGSDMRAGGRRIFALSLRAAVPAPDTS